MLIHSLDGRHIEWFSVFFETLPTDPDHKTRTTAVIQQVFSDFNIRQQCGERANEGCFYTDPAHLGESRVVLWKQIKGCGYAMVLDAGEPVHVASHTLANWIHLVSDAFRTEKGISDGVGPKEFLQKPEEIHALTEQLVPNGLLLVADTFLLRRLGKEALERMK